MIDFAFELDLAPPTKTAQQKGERAVIGEDGKPFVIHYKRAEIKRIEAAFCEALRPHAPPAPLAGPLGVSFALYFPATKDGAAKMKRAGVAVRRKVTKPDLDNSLKSALDCMTRERFWPDDSAVALLHAEKFETVGKPRVAVRVRELAPYPGELFEPKDREDADAADAAQN